MDEEATTPRHAESKSEIEQGSPSSVLDLGKADSWQGPFRVSVTMLRHILERAFKEQVLVSPFVLEQVARVPEFDPVLTINFKMNRIVAKKPAGMTTQAAVAALLGTLTNYADKVLEFPDPHQVSHQLVAFFEDSSRIYEAREAMKAALPWAFSPSLTAMQLLGHAGPPEEPVATDAVITVKNARKSDGDALSMGFFVL